MCGIAGIIDFTLKDKSVINNMIKSLKHRGPDNIDNYIDMEKGIFFAHSRLSILDLSVLGNQPMESQSGRYIISFNGEIYNHLHLRNKLKNIIDGKVDLVLSDMASETTGHKPTDHIRTQGLAELAADYAINFLNPGGAFCSKVFHGGAHDTLLKLLKENFTEIKHYKPPASRKESPENYVIAKKFKK